MNFSELLVFVVNWLMCLAHDIKVHYSVVSEEPDVALYHVRHVINVEKEQTGSKNGS